MSGNLLPNENDSAEQRQAKLDMQVTVIEALFEAAKNGNEDAAQLWLRARLASDLALADVSSIEFKMPTPKRDEVTREEIQGAGFIDGTDRTAQFLSLVTAKEFDEKEYEAWGKRMNRLNGEHHH